MMRKRPEKISYKERTNHYNTIKYKYGDRIPLGEEGVIEDFSVIKDEDDD